MITPLAFHKARLSAAFVFLAGVVTVTTVDADQTDAASTGAENNGVSQIVISPRPRLAPVRQVAVRQQAVAQDAAADVADAPPAAGLPVIVPGPVCTPSYWAIYRTIPFSRAEYNANPSYRHEAAMELLTGNPRPPKIHINSPPSAAPIDFFPINPYNPRVLRNYFDTTRGPYSRYPHLFDNNGGYRPKYYRK